MKKKTLIIILLLFMLACIAVLLFRPAKTESKTYPVDLAFQRIEIRNGTGDVEIKPSEDGACTVVATETAKVKYDVAVKDGTLQITFRDSRTFWDRFSFFTKKLTVTVYLPDAEYQSLLVEGSTGDVKVSGPFAFGDVSIGVSTGDIDLRDGRPSRMEIHVSTGRVRVYDAKIAGAFSLTVSTGDADLKNVTCDSFSSAGSTGDITMNNVTATGALRIERSTGDIQFKNCDAGEIYVKTSTGDVSGTLRSGKLFKARSTTGKIQVPESFTGGPCEITTTTGDIRIELSRAEQ